MIISRPVITSPQQSLESRRLSVISTMSDASSRFSVMSNMSSRFSLGSKRSSYVGGSPEWVYFLEANVIRKSMIHQVIMRLRVNLPLTCNNKSESQGIWGSNRHTSICVIYIFSTIFFYAMPNAISFFILINMS